MWTEWSAWAPAAGAVSEVRGEEAAATRPGVPAHGAHGDGPPPPHSEVGGDVRGLIWTVTWKEFWLSRFLFSQAGDGGPSPQPWSCNVPGREPRRAAAGDVGEPVTSRPSALLPAPGGPRRRDAPPAPDPGRALRGHTLTSLHWLILPPLPTEQLAHAPAHAAREEPAGSSRGLFGKDSGWAATELHREPLRRHEHPGCTSVHLTSALLSQNEIRLRYGYISR